MDSGLFTQPLTEDDFRKNRHREIFDLDAGISRAERLLVESAGYDLIADMKEDDPKRYERLCTEFHRYSQCGNEFLPLDCIKCETQHYVPIRCRSRLCEDCNKAWAQGIKKQLGPEIGKLNSNKRKGFAVSHVVLTVEKWWNADRMPGPEEIKLFSRWCSDFTRLHYGKHIGAWSRSGKVVERRKRFQGGAWVRVLEFGLDNNNLHAHLIVYGPLKPKTVLDASWSRITGNRGRWIWIQRVKKTKHAVSYIMKELVKAPVSEGYVNMAGYVIAIKGTRRLATGGILYNRIRSRLVDPDKPRFGYSVCGGLLLPGESGSLQNLGSRVNLWPELYKLARMNTDKKAALASLEAELPNGVMPVSRNDLPLFCN